MVTISVELGGGQENEGGWRADAEGTDVKGGRKRRGSAEKKGQEEDGDHPRTVENNTESQNLRNGEGPKTTKRTHILIRGC